MKILIYGFKSYKHWKKDVTSKILRKIPKKTNIVKVILPIKFEKKPILDKIRKHKPDLIIGIGQHSRGRKVKIERIAKNIKKVNRKAEETMISKKGSKSMTLNLKIDSGGESWTSYDAGNGICNYSMYVVSSNAKGSKFVFFNFPKKYDPKRAAEIINRRIEIFESELKTVIAQKSLNSYFT